MCKNWYSHSNTDEYTRLLGFDTMVYMTYRSSVSFGYLKLMMKRLRSFRKLVTVQQLKLCNNPVELKVPFVFREALQHQIILCDSPSVHLSRLSVLIHTAIKYNKRYQKNIYYIIVGIATRYGLDGPGIESRWGRDFPHPSRPALGPPQPPVQWVSGLSRG